MLPVRTFSVEGVFSGVFQQFEGPCRLPRSYKASNKERCLRHRQVWLFFLRMLVKTTLRAHYPLPLKPKWLDKHPALSVSEGTRCAWSIFVPHPPSPFIFHLFTHFFSYPNVMVGQTAPNSTPLPYPFTCCSFPWNAPCGSNGSHPRVSGLMPSVVTALAMLGANSTVSRSTSLKFLSYFGASICAFAPACSPSSDSSACLGALGASALWVCILRA